LRASRNKNFEATSILAVTGHIQRGAVDLKNGQKTTFTAVTAAKGVKGQRFAKYFLGIYIRKLHTKFHSSRTNIDRCRAV
jgi:hypothetical protein